MERDISRRELGVGRRLYIYIYTYVLLDAYVYTYVSLLIIAHNSNNVDNTTNDSNND